MIILDLASISSGRSYRRSHRKFNLFKSIRNWLDRFEIKDIQTAKLICRWIPASCPFERDVKLFGRTLFHIPPLCHLNPLYQELSLLRFRAEIFLAADSN
ncbi:nitrogenase [Candidatus Gracilibacteria bacterium]|jgi:Mo-dependent nitrogenase C-terminus|nr:nitrogenase [Candidatus Gracilibacteria bacterium]NJM87943.1 nitrogenase [Hydrococcus sp. RU_2_2]NJP21186.1 nitrogenase [Hydrococcus sp. CRU_1_1]